MYLGGSRIGTLYPTVGLSGLSFIFKQPNFQYSVTGSCLASRIITWLNELNVKGAIQANKYNPT